MIQQGGIQHRISPSLNLGIKTPAESAIGVQKEEHGYFRPGTSRKHHVERKIIDAPPVGSGQLKRTREQPGEEAVSGAGELSGRKYDEVEEWGEVEEWKGEEEIEDCDDTEEL